MGQFDGQEKHANMSSHRECDINFNVVTTPSEMVTALQQFNEQVVQARNAGILDEAMAIDAQRHITQVIIQISKSTMNRVFLLKHLTAAASCVATASTLGLVLYGAIPALLKLIG